jgi:alpha-ketoglutarate-dependent taurine dioxygenase
MHAEARSLAARTTGRAQPALTCRLRWVPKTLTMWDNRLCLDQAFNDDDGNRCEMHRTTIAGKAPA